MKRLGKPTELSTGARLDILYKDVKVVKCCKCTRRDEFVTCLVVKRYNRIVKAKVGDVVDYPEEWASCKEYKRDWWFWILLDKIGGQK